MRVILLSFALVAASALPDATSAAAKSWRPGIKAECVRLAAAQNFGRRHIHRRRFIQDCIIDPEFNAPDLL